MVTTACVKSSVGDGYAELVVLFEDSAERMFLARIVVMGVCIAEQVVACVLPRCTP
jgi:hypothetical protein